MPLYPGNSWISGEVLVRKDSIGALLALGRMAEIWPSQLPDDALKIAKASEGGHEWFDKLSQDRPLSTGDFVSAQLALDRFSGESQCAMIGLLSGHSAIVYLPETDLWTGKTIEASDVLDAVRGSAEAWATPRVLALFLDLLCEVEDAAREQHGWLQDLVSWSWFRGQNDLMLKRARSLLAAFATENPVEEVRGIARGVASEAGQRESADQLPSPEKEGDIVRPGEFEFPGY